MSLFYNRIQRINPRDREAPMKWYPVLKSIGMLREKDVAKLIADETTLNPKEAEMSLAQLEKILVRTLLDGKSVQLGDWGSFYLTLSTEGSEQREEANPDKVKKVQIRFRPGRKLQEAIDKATFIEASTLIP